MINACTAAKAAKAEAAADLLTAEQIALSASTPNVPVKNTVELLADRQLPAHTARDLRGLATASACHSDRQHLSVRLET